MSNEYLKRKPVPSPGNTRVWTWASWFKLNETSPTVDWAWLFNTSVNGGILINYGGSPYDSVVYFYDHAGSIAAGAAPSFRDLNAWYHLTVNYDSTEKEEKERLRFYMNGERLEFSDTITPTWPVLNYKSSFNDHTKIHSIGRWEGGATRYIKAQYCDQFWVDGQAIAPEVFGFYKNGDGYMSSGTTNQTDFKSGQWCPRLPRSIRHTIDSSGGFGPNGFYLPMNDSSNPGADFHCTPNTIVKLKGEDEPQPQNGAPTTSDSFVSQLREESVSAGLPFEGVVKFGGDGTNSSLKFPDDSDFDLGGSPFTAECWIYPIDGSGSNYAAIFNKGYGFQVYWKDNIEALQLFGNSTGSGNYDLINGVTTPNGSVPKGRWTHIAVVREPGNNTWKMYTNGKLTYGPLVVSGSLHNNGNDWVIGDYGPAPGNYELNGFISDFRLVVGSAVYTSDFTPPTTRLTNIANTKLLCCQSSTSVTEAAVSPTTGGTAGGANTFATKNELTGSIILAVPFISHPTGSNLLDDGNFVNDNSQWTLSDTAAPTISNGKLIFNGTSGTGLAQRAQNPAVITTGNTYIVKLSVAFISGTLQVRIGNSGYTDTITQSGTYTLTIKAGSTPTETILFYGNSFNGTVAGVEIYQQDTIRDYSADIRGTGTNKTVDVKGNFNVATYPSHYGSALICKSGADSYVEVASNDEFANLLDVDHTIEFWYKNDIWDDSYLPHHSIIGLKSSTNPPGCVWRFAFTDKNTNEDGIQLFGTNGFSSGAYTLSNDWNHCAVEQYTVPDGTIRTTVYINGIAAAQNTGPVGHVGDASTGPLVIGTDPRSANLGDTYSFVGKMQDVRIYKGVAKYKGGFDVTKPYSPVNFTWSGGDSWRTNSDNSKNNFCTWNFNKRGNSNPMTLDNGNLTMNQSNSFWRQHLGTHGMSSGKFYYEAKTITDKNYAYIGIADDRTDVENYTSADNHGWALLTSNGKAYHDQNGTQSLVDFNTALSTGITHHDVIGVAFDADNGRIWWSVRGTWLQGDPATGASPVFDSEIPTGETYFPAAGCYSESSHVNFGQNPSFCGTEVAGTNTDSNGKGLFKYAPPTGFLALCDDNLPTPIADPGKHFKTVLYTGDSSFSKSINGVGFKPDLVWVKCRSHSKWGPFVDSVRGNTTTFYTNSSNATNNEIHVPNFSSDGFTVADVDSGTSNEADYTYVAWCWKAGGKAVTNNDGSVTSKVSVNQEAGFSIVKFTSQTTNNAITIGHGLGKKPAFWLWKDINGATGWYVYHKDMGSSAWLKFNNDDAETGNSAAWGGVDPTDTVFTQGSGFVNQNDVMVYAWAEIEGYSKFGSYSGKSSTNGAFINCGFKPAFVMIKSTTLDGSSWIMVDSSRDPVNPCTRKLFPNYSGEENVSNPAGATADTNHIDLLSNGFKCRKDNSWTNNSGDTYIFAAFAESPFQTANAK